MIQCWCGNADLIAFNADYWRCPGCESLVAREMPGPDLAVVRDDAQDLYGRSYWYQRQENVHGYANIEKRARLDLPERCLHWLRALLKYKRPPARVLELGCAHGGFVALLHWAGFDAAGLELSPSIVEWAAATFEVPILEGPVERQELPAHSFDVIALMDVVEHLPDPVATLRRCLSLLREDGCMIVQTPNYPAGASYESMVEANDPFLEQLKPSEHLFLFSRSSAAKLLEQAGAGHCSFEPAIFSHYDQFFVASRQPPAALEEPNLAVSPPGRMVQALLDLEKNRQEVVRRLEAAEADRVARLAVIHNLGQRLDAAEADRAARLEVIQDFARRMESAEADRAATLEVIREFAQRTEILETERAAQREVLQDLARRLELVQTEQLRLADEFGRLCANVERKQAAQTALASDQSQQISTLSAELSAALSKCLALEALSAAQAETARNQEAQTDALRRRLDNLDRGYEELSGFIASLRRSFAGRTLEKLGLATFPIKDRARA